MGATLLLLALWAVKSIAEKKVVLNANPFDAPVFAFGAIVLVSSIISKNRFDSLFQSIPLLLAILLFFVITNTIKDKKGKRMVVASLLLGAAVASLLSTLYFLNLFVLPVTAIRSRYFNSFGSSIQQIAYTLPLLAFVVYKVAKKLNFPKFKINMGEIQKDYFFLIEAGSLLLMALGLVAIVWQIIVLPQKPIVLPYAYGLQTAFATISQDASRFLASFFFGSGYGTFLADFTRFRLPAFNLEPNIWNLSFSYSSSYFLELIATTGLLGAVAFLSILVVAIKTKVNSPLFFSLFFIFVLAFLLPFSFTVVALVFIILALYSVSLTVNNDKRVFDITIVALKLGLNPFETKDKKGEGNLVLPIIFSVIVALLVVLVGYYTFTFMVSDVKFAQSLKAANANNAQATYQLQTQAIQAFPYRSDYHRIFSQINLAIANSLVSQNQKPNQQMQQNIVSLLQQAIASAKNAATLSPLTSQNLQNLSNIYRNLINVGQNADQFAILTMNQAIALDPYNPQLYIQLGGIYYQLNQYDAAQTQFQTAIKLKGDFANAYYNLGHTLEAKGNLTDALSAYQVVRQLVKDNAENLRKIESEISVLQSKVGKTETKPVAQVEQPTKNQPNLDVNTPSVTLPPQKPPIKISPPPGSASVTPSTAPKPTVTPATP